MDDKQQNFYKRLLINIRVKCLKQGIKKSSNISKTTAANQCKRVPDLRRPGSVRIKRYCAKTVD